MFFTFPFLMCSIPTGTIYENRRSGGSRKSIWGTCKESTQQNFTIHLKVCLCSPLHQTAIFTPFNFGHLWRNENHFSHPSATNWSGHLERGTAVNIEEGNSRKQFATNQFGAESNSVRYSIFFVTTINILWNYVLYSKKFYPSLASVVM